MDIYVGSCFNNFVGNMFHRKLVTYEARFVVSIITIATTKGGAGKTTLARLILGRAAITGLKAAAIDADFNHTLTDWVSTVASYPIAVCHELERRRSSRRDRTARGP